jgi:rhodanese-related sulfurtransferase
MKIGLIVLAIVSMLAIGTWLILPSNECSGESCQAKNSTTSEPLAKTAVNQANQGNAYILDVRTPDEFNGQHLSQAKNFDVELLKTGQMPQLPKDANIYVYCRSGNRSAQASDILKNNGFSNITDLGGLDELKSAGVL